MVTPRTFMVAVIAATAVLAPLAALRPAAQAQAKIPAAPAPPATDALPEGVRVELAGVTEAVPGTTALTKPWWGAAGDVLPAPLLRTSNYQFLPMPSPSLYRALAFKITSPDGQPVTVLFRPAQSEASSSDGGWAGKMVNRMVNPAPATEAKIDAPGGYRMLYALYPANVAAADVRVGVGAGPWQTAASATDTMNGSMAPAQGFPCIFGPLTPVVGGSQVTISLGGKDGHALTDANDLRVVAVDAAGHEQLPETVGDDSVGALDQIQARFGLMPDAIKAIRLQTRSLHWVTFPHVALQPRS